MTITIDLAELFTGGTVLWLLLAPVFFAMRHERNRYIARVWGEKEIAL